MNDGISPNVNNGYGEVSWPPLDAVDWCDRAWHLYPSPPLNRHEVKDFSKIRMYKVDTFVH